MDGGHIDCYQQQMSTLDFAERPGRNQQCCVAIVQPAAGE
jgi:hypothetical protein